VTAQRAGVATSTGRALGAACLLVALWHACFAVAVQLGTGEAYWTRLVPPLAALAVPAAAMTLWGWWRSPWLYRMRRDAVGALVPLLLVELLLVGTSLTPPGVIVLAIVVTGLSEELVARGVVQQLLHHLGAVPQVLLSGGLLAVGYAVSLAVLGEEAAYVSYVVGMALCFGVAHAALRRRGVPVLALAAMNGLVVWPQFAERGWTPLTFVASVIAVVFGIWSAAEDRAGRDRPA
jgi:membrane protease YdiL (CAAX protease family)